MNLLSKKIILPIIIGFLFYLFLLIGENADIISKDKTFSLISIGLGAMLLYVIVFGILQNKDNLTFGFAGLVFAQVFFSIGIPILVIIYKIYFLDYETKMPESLIEKDKIVFKTDSKKYLEIKYGVFVKGYDTINRFTKDNYDFELIKTFNGEKLYKIKWLDSCSYCRINQRNNSVAEIVKIGNFTNGKHEMYIKPAVTHKMEEERIESAYKIKNYR